MLCVNPFRPRPGVEHGCGQCKVCRLNRRREWTARIVLESITYPASSFVTLSYAPEHLPPDGSLSDVHWRSFTKGIGYRYFGVGEYGTSSERPHYHVVLFGLDPGQASAVVTPRWPYGFIHIGNSVTTAVARYVASYTVKKLTSAHSEWQAEKLAGRRPEFARMSRRPAIGRPGLEFVIRWLVTPDGRRWMSEHRDVPNVVQVDRRAYPLGRTLVNKLRELADIPSDDPLRREARENRLRLINLDPVLKKERERLRYARYDVLKARMKHERHVL